tara:strand:- start:745 stop:1320 length:576 start_codon:yes stop_codon:yes gene_type:complete
MWALVESGSISKVYNKPTQLTIGDIKYPSNIHNLWSESELKAIGVYIVIIDNTNYKDPEYYINTNQSFAFDSNKVTATYGTATARALDDSGSGETLIRGLKYTHCETIDNQAYGLLQPNDWMVVKATETSGSVASDWTTYRAGVRTAANDMITKINAVSDVDALAALYVYNDADPPVRPLVSSQPHQLHRR